MTKNKYIVMKFTIEVFQFKAQKEWAYNISAPYIGLAGGDGYATRKEAYAAALKKWNSYKKEFEQELEK